jgi:hypothetical protein
VVEDATALKHALAAMDEAELARDGLVLEENLLDVSTFSVGQVVVADLTISYCGTQRLTRDNAGANVYGGSDLLVVSGDYAALARVQLSEACVRAIEQAQTYDVAARNAFAGMFASRRNYDVIQGLDSAGRPRSGVLEQSWRIGGASSAEVAALQVFRTCPETKVLRSSCHEVYGAAAQPPPGAAVLFSGVDDNVGPLTKYTMVFTDVDA